jgi:predicted dehydrogenase
MRSEKSLSEPTATAPIRFLVSGPGLIGKKHCALIRASASCNLTAVVAPDSHDNRATADEFGAAFYTSLDEALGNADDLASEIDAVIISSPNAFHFDQALACIERKIPVLVEKPVTNALASARELARRATEANVPVLVGHHRTHSTLLAVADSFLRSEHFGRLVSVMGSAQFYKPAKYFVDGAWRTQVGGGPILINLIHEIGLMRHFCGEISSVVALASNSVRGFEVEDSVSISLRFAEGALGTFMLSDTAASSKSWEMTAGENPAYPHFPDEDCYHFAGTQGSLDFPSMNIRSYASEADRSWWLPFVSGRLAVERKDPLSAQLDHFIAVIRGQEEPIVTAYHGYRNMLVIEAIARSIREARIVDLTELEAE